ncbi:hypothetical protein CR513_05788, partial [Mucuna pruriens]
MARWQVIAHIERHLPLVSERVIVTIPIVREICVNVASERLVRKLALPTIVHFRPYKLQWLSEGEEVQVRQQVEVSFSIGRYQDKVLCDVVPMEATLLLLNRPWQFDRKVTHDGVTNKFTFVHIKHKVVLKPLSPIEVQEDQNKMRKKRKKIREVEKRETETKKEKKSKKIKSVKNMGIKELTKSGKSNREEREVRKVTVAKREPLYAMPTNMLLYASSSSLISLPTCMKDFLKEFKNMFPEDIPPVLPPLRGIKHHIDLSLGAILPNKATYKMNPEEGKKIQKIVVKLLENRWVRESMSLCAMHVILVPKKDSTWRMCTYCKPINNIIVRYRHLIPHLEDFLDELHGSQMFSKIDLKSGYH